MAFIGTTGGTVKAAQAPLKPSDNRYIASMVGGFAALAGSIATIYDKQQETQDIADLGDFEKQYNNDVVLPMSELKELDRPAFIQNKINEYTKQFAKDGKSERFITKATKIMEKDLFKAQLDYSTVIKENDFNRASDGLAADLRNNPLLLNIDTFNEQVEDLAWQFNLDKKDLMNSTLTKYMVNASGDVIKRGTTATLFNQVKKEHTKKIELLQNNKFGLGNRSDKEAQFYALAKGKFDTAIKGQKTKLIKAAQSEAVQFIGDIKNGTRELISSKKSFEDNIKDLRLLGNIPTADRLEIELDNAYKTAMKGLEYANHNIYNRLSIDMVSDSKAKKVIVPKVFNEAMSLVAIQDYDSLENLISANKEFMKSVETYYSNNLENVQFKSNWNQTVDNVTNIPTHLRTSLIKDETLNKLIGVSTLMELKDRDSKEGNLMSLSVAKEIYAKGSIKGQTFTPDGDAKKNYNEYKALVAKEFTEQGAIKYLNAVDTLYSITGDKGVYEKAYDKMKGIYSSVNIGGYKTEGLSEDRTADDVLDKAVEQLKKENYDTSNIEFRKNAFGVVIAQEDFMGMKLPIKDITTMKFDGDRDFESYNNWKLNKEKEYEAEQTLNKIVDKVKESWNRESNIVETITNTKGWKMTVGAAGETKDEVGKYTMKTIRPMVIETVKDIANSLVNTPSDKEIDETVDVISSKVAEEVSTK